MADSVREEIRAEDEPDLSSDDESIGSPEENWHLHACLTIERGLDPLYMPEDIQRIQEDAINADMPDTGAAVAASDAPILNVEPVRKRRCRDNMSSGVWVHFKKGVIQADGFYDATCLYCSKVYQMGNQKSTSSLRHHFEKGCRKVPSSKRHKPDAS